MGDGDVMMVRTRRASIHNVASGGSRGGHHRSGTGAVTTAIPVVAVVVRVVLRRNVCSALVPLLVGRRAFLHPLLHRRQLLVLLLLVARHAIRVPLGNMMSRRLLLEIVAWQVEVVLGIDLLHIKKRRRVHDERVGGRLLGPRRHQGHLPSSLWPGYSAGLHTIR